MTCYVECNLAGTNSEQLPVEEGGPIWSEMLASGATSANKAPANGYYVTVSADLDGYVKIGPAPATETTQHRVFQKTHRSFYVQKNDRIQYTAG